LLEMYGLNIIYVYKTCFRLYNMPFKFIITRQNAPKYIQGIEFKNLLGKGTQRPTETPSPDWSREGAVHLTPLGA